jgi:hypothetical protein
MQTSISPHATQQDQVLSFFSQIKSLLEVLEFYLPEIQKITIHSLLGSDKTILLLCYMGLSLNKNVA